MRPDVPVVFVHGLFGPFNDAEAFHQLDQVECSAPDLDGYGPFAGRRVTFEGQVRALREHIQSRHPETCVHLVAHSIGAVYAFALADRSPDLVDSVTTVEGNFSLADAFWSRSIAALDMIQAQTAIEQRLSDPKAFLASDGIATTPENIAKAEAALKYQPWRTVWASASAIVETTASAEYEAMLKRVFADRRVHLVSGERSADGWNVPEWARHAAASSTVIPDVGHMMMLEQPETFGSSISKILQLAGTIPFSNTP